MIFGKRTRSELDDDVLEHIVLSDNEDNNDIPMPELNTQENTQNSQGVDYKPLLKEVTFIGVTSSKNAGGAKVWVCNHCKQQFTSSYTRIHIHFFGTAPGKKAEIKRCEALLKNREKYENLLKRVKAAETVGISQSLKKSVINKKQSVAVKGKNKIEESFGILERNQVDLKIMKGLCANGIPFNVLRNPHFIEMISAIQKAPAGYKPTSCFT